VSEAPALRLSGVSRRFGGTTAVDQVTLDVAAGELFCLLGPSGCGKTTLLRLIGGYLAPDHGTIALDGAEVTDVPLERRDIGMVFQSYALFPHMTARQNVAFGLTARGIRRDERERRSEAALDRVGLGTGMRGRRPKLLSGGEQQRVALARALVIEPRLLLLDEPMASLDRRLRESMRQEIKALHQRTHVTTLLVTHDQEDALFLADRLGIMAGGRLLQVGTPAELYRHPASAFVARFLGDANILKVLAIDSGTARLDGGMRLAAAGFAKLAAGNRMLVRPEHLRIAAHTGAEPGSEAGSGTVATIAFLGADAQVQVQLADGMEVLVRVRAGSLPGMAVGDRVKVSVMAGGATRLPGTDAPGRPWPAVAEEVTGDA
jgi:ABC-type Fe3+/spermidine/putrescine transport system ATPase subunit